VTDVFDRAALIALPADMRVRYVSTLREILPIDARIMLVTLTYPQQQMEGPPFSLSEEEVSTLYGSGYHIEKLCQTEILNQEPGFKAKGLDSLVETVYKMVPR
jgi:thiopurine S-methyltransferase